MLKFVPCISSLNTAHIRIYYERHDTWNQWYVESMIALILICINMNTLLKAFHNTRLCVYMANKKQFKTCRGAMIRPDPTAIDIWLTEN